MVEYILDEANDVEIQNVVSNANQWCRLNMRKDSLAKLAIESLEMYRAELDRFGIDEWATRWRNEDIVDLVECQV